jgi:glycerophosphoryl diester phosphodiesterase
MKAFITCLSLLLACSATKQSQNQAMPQIEFDKQGHRGCRGLMPENTISAMITALDLGMTTLEMDVVVTADKQLILSHEPFFSHDISTKPDGSPVTAGEEKNLNIYKMTIEEVQKYDVGMKPYPRFPGQQKIKAVKPLLSEVIDSVENSMITRRRPPPFYNIETKTTPATDNIFHPAPAEFVEMLVKLIKEKGIEERVIIQSFDFRTLQYLHQHYPGIKTAALVEGTDKKNFDAVLKSLGFTPDIYSPHFSLVNDDLIAKCHSAGIRIIPWTVNDMETIKKLRSMGVDGIITDFPNLFNE